MTSRRTLLLIVAVLATGAALSQARATPLDTDTCNKMMLEHAALEKAGVESNLAKGPDWAKANLTPDKIEQVRRFIELEETILFRCKSKSLVLLPPDPEDKLDKSQDAAKDVVEDADEAAEKEAADAASKAAAEKHETIIPKSAPAAKSKAPVAPGKLDAKKQVDPKARTTVKSAKTEPDTKDAPKAAPKAQPQGQPKVQAKAPPKKDAPGAKAPTKAAAQLPPRTGAGQKAPPAADAEDTSKAPQSPDAGSFGDVFQPK